MWFSKSTKNQHTRARGDDVERLAESFLKKQGLKLLERNYLVKGGEIDLVMKDSHVLVFIEVRYRKSEAHGSGAESVTARKQQRLNLAARHYLQRHFGSNEPDCRFDVISASGEPIILDWIKNAF